MKPSVELYVSGKKVKFWINFGWYPGGNDWSLVQISVIENLSDTGVLLFGIKVIYFVIHFGVDYIE
jgi:hypothetical protein